ncbi:MAG: dehydrogenase E1 component subunit alpha/beta [Steroidobacteraceae bacterium]
MLTIQEPEAQIDTASEKSAELTVDDFRRLAQNAPDARTSVITPEGIRSALRIREIELALLSLFGRGMMNGTVHTCIGQEFSAVAVAGQLHDKDWVTSNHRCHGHFIAKTGNWRALVDELMGLESGACRGIGSSQHLYAKGFLSNGVQGSLVPVGSGIALHQKRTRTDGLVASFVGEGTFGEGVLYEAMNLAAAWNLPQLFVCENNLYSQSTPQERALAGTLRGRAAAFGMRYFEADTWSLDNLFAVARNAIDAVRAGEGPALFVVRTYRLNAHSKGDDDRSGEEIDFFRQRDPISAILSTNRWRAEQQKIKEEVADYIETSAKTTIEASSYVVDQLPRWRVGERKKVDNERVRLVAALNRTYEHLAREGTIFIGEDIHDPYGGAFKVTKGIGERYGDRVHTTPISEAAITGLGAGLALMGERVFVEIMFGDFITNAFDQLINNISKFHHMYAFQVSAPVRIRTPMGGKRGYGPTHSQSLEKFLLGIDNVAVAAMTSLEDPAEALHEANALPGPIVIIESKVDYGRHLWQGNADYEGWKEGGGLGTLVLSPLRHVPTMSVVAYGETARELADSLQSIFIEADEIIELVIPVLLHPLDMRPIAASAGKTGRLVVIDDGSIHFGFGAEVVSALVERHPHVRCWRLGAEPVPIPSVVGLEKILLPGMAKLIEKLRNIRREEPI